MRNKYKIGFSHKILLKVKIFFKNLIIYLISLALLTVLIVPITSTSNLIWLSSMEMPIGLSEVFSVLLADLLNLGIILFLILLLPFGLGLIISKYTIKFIPLPANIWYFFISSLTMWLVLISTVEFLFQTEVIAGNRTSLGTFLHVMAGGIAGSVFYNLRYRMFV